MNLFLHQIKQAYFSLKQKPGFVFSVVSTMGITLGALLCVLTLAYVLFFKGLPYPEYQSLVKINYQLIDRKNNVSATSLNYPSMVELYKKQAVFKQSTMIYYNNKTLAIHSSQPTILAAHVTPEYFDIFAMPMFMGRAFDSNEGLNANIPLAVISHKTWLEVFEGNKDILNTTVKFWDTNYKIVGVSSPDFEEPLLKKDSTSKTQVWLSWDFNNLREWGSKLWDRPDENLVLIAQLVTNQSRQVTEKKLTLFSDDIWQAALVGNDFYKGWSINIELKPLVDAISGQHKNNLILLIVGIVGIVLIACANITNLFITRGSERARTMAISAVVGAKKWQLFNYSIAESFIVMSASLCLALGICYISLAFIANFLSAYIPRSQQFSLSWFTIACAVFLLFLLSLFFAFITARMVSYSSLISLLRASGKGVGAQLSARIRQFLIVSQVAIATLLVFVNIGLFQQAVTTLIEPAAINTENFIDISLTSTRPPTQKEIDGPVLGTAIRNEFLLLPKVAAVSNSLSPLSGFEQMPLTDTITHQHAIIDIKSIDELYFEMIGQPMLSGDTFSRDDLHEGFTAPEGKVESNSLIVNEKLAYFLDTKGKAIGRSVLIDGDETYKVVGIVKGVKMPGQKTIPMRAYIPSSVHSISMTVQLKEDQKLSREEVVAAVKRVTGFFALSTMHKVTDIHKNLLFSQKVTAYTTGVLAILTIILSMIGLYGVLSYAIHTQRFELGTRMAIGAKGKEIIVMILKNNLNALLIGFAICSVFLVAGYLSFVTYLSSYINISLAVMFILSLILIALISFTACYMPLRQCINKPTMYSLRGSD